MIKIFSLFGVSIVLYFNILSGYRNLSKDVTNSDMLVTCHTSEEGAPYTTTE